LTDLQTADRMFSASAPPLYKERGKAVTEDETRGGWVRKNVGANTTALHNESGRRSVVVNRKRIREKKIRKKVK